MDLVRELLRDWTGWISAASAIAAFASILVSLRSNRIAKRSLEIAEENQSRSKPNLAVYLAEGYCRYEKDRRLVTFILSVTNNSDSRNSLARGELKISYTMKSGNLVSLKLPPIRTAENGSGELLIPQNFDAQQTVAGALRFEIHEALIGGLAIDNYTLLLYDSAGMITSLDHPIIRDVDYESYKDNAANSKESS